MRCTCPRRQTPVPFSIGPFDAANLVEALEEKENSDLCLAIYRDLRQAAFEPMRDGLATIRYRVAKLACDLGSRFFEFRVCATWGQGL